eukprot:8324249-Pyramimonas_sp.AAC.1
MKDPAQIHMGLCVTQSVLRRLSCDASAAPPTWLEPKLVLSDGSMNAISAIATEDWPCATGAPRIRCNRQ